MEIIKNNQSGPNIEELLKKLDKNPEDINLILEVADKYFSIQSYENSMDLLLKNYPKIKIKLKKKWLNFLMYWEIQMIIQYNTERNFHR